MKRAVVGCTVLLLFSAAARADLLVSEFVLFSEVKRYDSTTGAFIDTFVPELNGLFNASGLGYGPDGNLYVVSQGGDGIVSYDGVTGAPINAITGDELDCPVDLAFGSDGLLYVNNRNLDDVLRYDPTTGAFLGTFVAAGSGGLDAPEGITFGPDGSLYVVSGTNNSVLRYDTSGQFLNTVVSPGSGGLSGAQDVVVGPDGHLYVTSMLTDQVLRYDGTTGSFLGVFAAGGGLDAPMGLAFGPDGNLYVASTASNSVLRYSGPTGNFLDAFVPPGSGGLEMPSYLAFSAAAVPEPGSLALAGLGVLALLGYGWRRHRENIR